MTTATDTQVQEQEPTDAERAAIFGDAAESIEARANAVERDSDDERDDIDPDLLARAGELDASGSTTTAAPANATPAAAPQPATTKPAASPQTPPAPAQKPVEQMNADELRAYSKKLENERNSALGRAAAAAREAERIRTAAKATPAPAPAALPEGERLENAFPDLHAPVKAVVDEALAAERARVNKEIEATNVATLEAIRPGWFATMRSDDFQYWLTQQPETVRTTIETSMSPADYVGILGSYDKSKAPSAPAAPSEAERLAADRQRRMDQRTSVPTGRSSPGDRTSGEPDAETNPDGLFNMVAAQMDLKRERSERRR